MLFQSGLKFGKRFSNYDCEVGFILFSSTRISYNVVLYSLFKENMMILDSKIVNTFSIISQNFFPRTREGMGDLSNEKLNQIV